MSMQKGQKLEIWPFKILLSLFVREHLFSMHDCRKNIQLQCHALHDMAHNLMTFTIEKL